MKEKLHQPDSKFPNSHSHSHSLRCSPSRREIGERRRFAPNSEGNRLSQFNEGLYNGESPSMKFQWNRLLLEQHSEPAKIGIDSNQSSYDSTRYGFSSTRVTTERDYQSNRCGSYSLNANDVGVSIGSANLDYRFTLPSRNFDVTRELYNGEGNTVIYSNEISGYKRLLSRVKGIEYTGTENLGISKEDSPGSFDKGLFVPSDEYRLSTGKSEMITTPRDRYDRESRIRSPDLSPTERNHGQRSVRDNISTVCEEYGGRDLLRTSIVDPIVERIDECSHREHSRESSGEQYGEVLGYGIAGLEYEEGQIYEDNGGLFSREGHLFDEEDSEMLLMGQYDQCLDGISASPQEHCLNEPYGTMLKPKRGIEKKSTRYKFVNKKNSSTHSSSGRDIKKRLGPGPEKVNVSPRWLRYNQSSKLGRKIQDGSHGGVHARGGEYPSVGNVSVAKAEPPENSEDFKQMVNSFFLRYVKQLNESSAQRRRFMEHGKVSGLKCSICGSNSKEFIDSKSLAMHAYVSPKLGLRMQHLGFHKALCVLMGWKSGMAANNRSWVCEILSDAKALALKEDLIVWPPVVIIHNTSIQNKNPDERVIVSIEALETMLKDMGFGGKATICRGKPANQSIMVVKFNGTFSGLQEAERLHKLYAETKRGRPDLQPMESSNSSGCTGETQNEVANKPEFVLFGYLGLAEDLDKLDFETKKRCFVKSKKETQDIANAPLKTE